MKKKAIILAICGVLATPSVFAAEDDMGMHFTSASEGLYGSIRAGLFDNVVDDYGSRIGVNGYNDLSSFGDGLEGFYTFEFRTDKGNNNVRNNKSQVGLRGEFGEFKIGRGFDAAPYELVYGGTDIANWQSGSAKGGYAGSSNVYYRTPSMNGFQAGIGFQVDGSNDGDEDVDNWNIAAQYSMEGLTAGAAYSASPSGFQVEDANGAVDGTFEDKSAWGVSLGYSQDNWSLNGWYGQDNSSDQGFAGYTPRVKEVKEVEGVADNPATEADETVDAVEAVAFKPEVFGTEAKDRSAFSLAGKVAVNQMDLYAVYESIDGIADGDRDIYTTLGATYHLGAKARVWMEYIVQDLDSDTEAGDYVAIGLRHDF